MRTEHVLSTGRPVTFEGGRLYRVRMRVEGRPGVADEAIVAADREGQATTRLMLLTSVPLRGEFVEYDVLDLGREGEGGGEDMTVVQTDEKTLRDAFERRREAGHEPAVMFKHEDEEDEPIGPVWMVGPGDSEPMRSELVPLAISRWDEEDMGESPAWYPLSYARQYARQVGAELVEV
jgi:hypothetical protein